jgi:pilus assembly protein CpaF
MSESSERIPEEIFQQALLGFLEPIGPFLADDKVSEVMINGHEQIFVERGGKIERTQSGFPTQDALETAVRNIAQYVGKTVDADRPILDARLPDGSRVCAVLPPASPHGITVSIRRFPKSRLTVRDLVEKGAISPGALKFLQLCVQHKRNILVAGGTGSGKTSLLNALSSFIGETERVVVIEDSSEIRLQQPHAVYLEARPPDPRGRGAVSIRDLLRATLRLRPDRIIVGECRGGEALDLVQAMTSGHGGSLSTVHATHPHDTVQRLETLCLMSDVSLPLSALRAQVASAVNVIVQTNRLNDGSRRITDIVECRGLSKDGHYDLNPLFTLRVGAVDPRTGRIDGQLVATKRPVSFAEELAGYGARLPEEMRG